MVHTVGIVGANGQLGNPTAKLLAQSAKDGKLKLVILHRAGHAPEGFDNIENVELRIIDLTGSIDELSKAVKGINVMISALGFAIIANEPKLVEALATSSDIITYIPTTFSTTWTQSDREDKAIGAIINPAYAGRDKAVEKGVGVTLVYVGAFENYFFEYGIIGCSSKTNTVWANQKQMKNQVPITTIEHLAQGLAHLAILEPESIKNTTQSFVSYWPTGQEVAELFTKINGKPATIKDFTGKNREEVSAGDPNLGPVRVGYWDKWENNAYTYSPNTVDFDGPGIEEVARRFA